MSRPSLRAAILLLSLGMVTMALTRTVVARTAAGSAGNAQLEPGNAQSPTTTNGPLHMIEGCLSNIDDAFILTDENGRTYRLTGDVAQLMAHSGSEVRIWGQADNVRDAESMVAAGPLRSFNVQRARSLSSGCPTLRG